MSKERSYSSKSIKRLADIYGAIGVFFTIAGGGICIVFGVFEHLPIYFVYGIISVTFGSWLVYATSRIIYGFGELVENTAIIAKDIHKLIIPAQSSNDSVYSNEYYDELDREN